MKPPAVSELLRAKERIERGEIAPPRVWSVTHGKDGKLHRRQFDAEQYRRQQKAEGENTVAATRSKLRRSQNKFAALLGISVKTLHNEHPLTGEPDAGNPPVRFGALPLN